MKDQSKVILILLVQPKKISINFSKAKTKFCLRLHYNGTNSYLFVNKAEIYKFKAHNNIRWYEFSLGCVWTDFMKYEQSEISLIDTV